jgi:hypothetical protein
MDGSVCPPLIDAGAMDMRGFSGKSKFKHGKGMKDIENK